MRRRRPGGDHRAAGEDGFALVAALAALMLFALFAYAMLAADRGAMADVDAQVRRAKLEAAADAGLAIALERLGASRGGWIADGRLHTLAVDDADVTAAVEEESDKVPLKNLSPDAARRLFQAAGVSGGRLDQLTDNFLTWLDGRERPNGATALAYAADGVRLRKGPLRTLDELHAIKGMNDAIFNRIAPWSTLFFGDHQGGGSGASSPVAKIIGLDGSQAQVPGGAAMDYVGQPLMVHLNARDAQDGVLQRTVIVELTGQPGFPVWIRATDDGRPAPSP